MNSSLSNDLEARAIEIEAKAKADAAELRRPVDELAMQRARAAAARHGITLSHGNEAK